MSPAPPTAPPAQAGLVARAWAALRAAWKLGPVKRGLLGTLLIETGSFTPAYLPQVSPIWVPLRALHLDGPVVKVVGTVIVMAGIGLLADGWFRLRKQANRPTNPWPTLAIWSFPFLFGPPIFSHDAYSYAAQGWLLLNGLNPYLVGPGVLPGTFADQVSTVWRDTTAPYGPLALRLSEALTWLAHGYPTVAAELQRLPAVLGVGLIATLLPKLARQAGADVSKVVWFACLNPLLVIDFVGGAHNDALMMGLVVLALWTASHGRPAKAALTPAPGPSGVPPTDPAPRPGSPHLYPTPGPTSPNPTPSPACQAGRDGVRAWPLAWLAGACLVGAAAAIKQPAFLAAVVLPFLAGPLPDWKRPGATLRAAGQAILALAVAVGAFALMSLACGLGMGWINSLGVPGSVATISPTSLIGESLQWLVNQSPSHAGVVGDRTVVTLVQTIGTALGFACIAGFALTIGRREPLRALAWSWLAIAILGPALHSWYVLWGGLLLPLTPSRRSVPRVAVAVTIVLLSYAAIDLAVRNGALAAGIAAAALLVWLGVIHERDRRAEEPADPAPACEFPALTFHGARRDRRT